MVACSAALTIRFSQKANINLLCAGLEDAASLTDLTHSLCDSSVDESHTPNILESLQRNSSLVRFALELDLLPEGATTITTRLLAVDSVLAYLRSLRRNGNLKVFSLCLCKDILYTM